MSRVVYKYLLQPLTTTTLSVPAGACVRHIGEQHGGLFAWIEHPSVVAPESPLTWLKLTVIGTGQTVPEPGRYVGTVTVPVLLQGLFVWHVYDTTPPTVPES